MMASLLWEGLLKCIGIVALRIQNRPIHAWYLDHPPNFYLSAMRSVSRSYHFQYALVTKPILRIM